MKKNELEGLLPAVVEIARLAGKQILTVYETDFDVRMKDDESPLTAADLAAHETILTKLAELTPDIPVLSEESREISYQVRAGWSRYWLVDPLDGTREFVNRSGEFTVNIALIEGHRPILGAVHVPVSGRDYYAAVGAGAWRQDAEAAPVEINVSQRCHRPVRVVGSKSHRGASLDAFLARLEEYELVAIGSSLKICLVAEGSADIYPRLGPTSEWDTAAAQTVVECAGGKLTDIGGEPLLYNCKDDLLNPFFLAFGDQSTDWPALVK
jgi:3'(2'), 5'-bisphosphate nucleotidase